MKNYESIEAAYAGRGRPGLWKTAQALLRERRMELARVLRNAIPPTDDELLVIAVNRVREQEVEMACRGWQFWRPRRLPDEDAQWVEVIGNELKCLLRLAGEREAEPVVGDEDYRVRFTYFKTLLRLGACVGLVCAFLVSVSLMLRPEPSMPGAGHPAMLLAAFRAGLAGAVATALAVRCIRS